MGSLLRSRKFWIAIAGGVAKVVADLTGIPAVGNAIVVLAGVLIGAIALEDAGEKASGKPPV